MLRFKNIDFLFFYKYFLESFFLVYGFHYLKIRNSSFQKYNILFHKSLWFINIQKENRCINQTKIKNHIPKHISMIIFKIILNKIISVYQKITLLNSSKPFYSIKLLTSLFINIGFKNLNGIRFLLNPSYLKTLNLKSY